MKLCVYVCMCMGGGGGFVYFETCLFYLLHMLHRQVFLFQSNLAPTCSSSIVYHHIHWLFIVNDRNGHNDGCKWCVVEVSKLLTFLLAV